MERGSHFFDRRLAPAIFGDLLILPAASGRNLTDQSQISALQLLRGLLLGRDPPTTTAALGPAFGGSSAGRTPTAASGRECLNGAANRPAGHFAQGLQTALELANFPLDVVRVPVNVARRNPALADQALQNIVALAGSQWL